MSSEAVLENPALFCDRICPRSGETLTQELLALEYLELAARFLAPGNIKPARAHIFKFLFTKLQVTYLTCAQILCALDFTRLSLTKKMIGLH